MAIALKQRLLADQEGIVLEALLDQNLHPIGPDFHNIVLVPEGDLRRPVKKFVGGLEVAVLLGETRVFYP